eukprot:9432518-Karenia_brevis.AAC.1
MRATERAAWREMLGVGGRSPTNCLDVILGLNSCVLEARLQRVAILLRLANAPNSAWEQAALIWHRHEQTNWYTDALADLRLVLPGLHFYVGMSRHGPVIYSSSWWTDTGEWCSAHPWSFRVDQVGRRTREQRCAITDRAVRCHIKKVTDNLRLHLTRAGDSDIFLNLTSSGFGQPLAKTHLLAQVVRWPGPPMSIAMNWIRLPQH